MCPNDTPFDLVADYALDVLSMQSVDPGVQTFLADIISHYSHRCVARSTVVNTDVQINEQVLLRRDLVFKVTDRYAYSMGVMSATLRCILSGQVPRQRGAYETSS